MASSKSKSLSDQQLSRRFCYIALLREGRSRAVGYIVVTAGLYGAGRELHREQCSAADVFSVQEALSDALLAVQRLLIPGVYIEPALLRLVAPALL